MKKIILGILVFLFLIGSLEIEQIWATNFGFKLISPKELIKELENSESERLKAWTLLNETLTSTSPFSSKGFISAKIYSEIELFVRNDIESLYHSIKEHFLKVTEFLIVQDFRFINFEKELSELRLNFKELIILFQKQLNPSKAEHQKALNKLNFALEQINKSELIFAISGLTETEINDYIKTQTALMFIRVWRERYFLEQIKKQSSQEGVIESLDEKMKLFYKGFLKAKYIAITIDTILEDKKVDEGREHEEFCNNLNELKQVLKESIQIIKTLPE